MRTVSASRSASLEEVVEVDGAADRRVLEERVVEVPRPEIVDARSRTASASGGVERRASTRRTAPRSRGRRRRGWRTAGPRRARRWRARGRSGRGSRGGARPRSGAARARGRGRRPRRRSASPPPMPLAASAESSLVRRISAIALSSTRRPSISPRKVLNVDSTSVSSSTIARRRSAATWWGTKASWSTSSWRATSGSNSSAFRARRFDGSERVRVAQQLASLQLDALPALRRVR